MGGCFGRLDAVHEISGKVLIRKQATAAQAVVLKRELADFIEYDFFLTGEFGGVPQLDPQQGGPKE